MENASNNSYGSTIYQHTTSNGSRRIASTFTALLETQFPVESLYQRMELRHPAEFANRLSVHVNHLNHTLKTVLGKTTSQLLSARLMQEARTLLLYKDWNVSEIAWSLGFEDSAHFINFFKKNQQTTPRLFRNSRFS